MQLNLFYQVLKCNFVKIFERKNENKQILRIKIAMQAFTIYYSQLK